jgi:predicted DCC family thiol-disulfide oxidoreductase YuxK
MVYDGDCGFCRRWIRRWEALTGDRVSYVPYQDVIEFYPEIPEDRFRNAVQFIETDGSVTEAAEAVCLCLKYSMVRSLPIWLYRTAPGLMSVMEHSYKWVASNRHLLSRISYVFTGEQHGPSTYLISRAVFLRLVGIVYLVAFLSFWAQVDGLIGKDGIMPATAMLEAARAEVGTAAYSGLPTLLWLAPSDATLHLLCGAGSLLSVILILGLIPMPALIALWIIYMSLVVSGQIFMGYQWEILLLETGLLAALMAPLQWRLSLSRKSPPRRIVIWLTWWLLFRLTLESGLVKLISNDDVWWNLTALQYHYWTQPIPTWTSWYAHQLPAWIQTLSCAVMFILEIGFPLLILTTRRLRTIGCAGLMLLQVLIAATGNYTYFNLLTLALCIPLLDDSRWPRRLRRAIAPPEEGRVQPRWLCLFVPHLAAVIAATVIILPISFGTTYTKIVHFAYISKIRRTESSMLGLVRPAVPSWAMRGVLTAADHCRLFIRPYPVLSVHGYGLFADMTEARPEIIVEGSHDLQTWHPYEFKWKPGDLAKRPSFAAPHQPRLDWQMWFAALGRYDSPRNLWFGAFIRRLLEGQPAVLELLASNPFPDAPPTYIRCRRFLYTFSDAESRKANGLWWNREPAGLYLPGAVTLEVVAPVPTLLYKLPE